MGLKGIIIRTAVSLYAAAYVAVSGHIAFDYVTDNRQRIEEGRAVQMLQINRYKVSVDGTEKNLVLIGENHSYTKREHELASQIVGEHKNFADECGTDCVKRLSFGNHLYLLLSVSFFSPASFFYKLGSGRDYDSVSEIAMKKKFYVHSLEDPNKVFDEMSLSERLLFFGAGVQSFFAAPLGYYAGKHQRPFDIFDIIDIEESPLKEINNTLINTLIDKRDPVLALTIAELLERKEVDSLVAAVGRAHSEGVIRHLSAHLKLEEIKD